MSKESRCGMLIEITNWGALFNYKVLKVDLCEDSFKGEMG